MNLDNLKSEIKIIDTKRSELKDLVNQFKRILLKVPLNLEQNC